jgi:hypothetical protein
MHLQFIILFCSAVFIMAVVSGRLAAQSRTPYIETFDHGPGGWYSDRYYALDVWDGVAYCYGPWWVDANHAPPGAGYLNLIMWLYTNKRKQAQGAKSRTMPYANSAFVEQGKSTDLRNAKLTVRLRGNMDLKGTHMVFLVQAETKKTTANFVLTGQPFKITREWSEQTVTLVPDPKHWTCMGARHDMTDVYGCDDIAKVLADVNLDIIFVLFPVKVVPLCEKIKDINQPRAVKDYPVDPQYLPKGLIMFDTVRIDYPQ